jgi:hypothetical protein
MTLHPGQPCPSCDRRIPYPKTAQSPKTKVFSVRIPLDDAEGFAELVDAVAEHVGVAGTAHERYKALQLALVIALRRLAREVKNVRGGGRYRSARQ